MKLIWEIKIPKRKILEQNQTGVNKTYKERKEIGITSSWILQKSYYNKRGKFVHVLDSGKTNLNTGPKCLASV